MTSSPALATQRDPHRQTKLGCLVNLLPARHVMTSDNVMFVQLLTKNVVLGVDMFIVVNLLVCLGL